MIVSGDVSTIAGFVERNRGTVFAYPTETFYGLGAKIKDDLAIERILQIKGRVASKGMIVLVPDIPAAESLANIDPRQKRILEQFWPGALSVLLDAKKGMNPLLCPSNKIALRHSPCTEANELIALTGPITSTSANVSGMPPASSPEEIIASGLEIDCILDGGRTPGEEASTLVDLSVWPPVCIRQGAIDFEKITDFIQKME